jgi:ATP-dependent Clp protease adaptor protein ClpS
MKTEELEITDLLESVEGTFVIVLHNDDVNTFDWVIECLMELCEHTLEQAEQCAMFVHYKGKCTVKHGSFEQLGPICNDLCRRGLSATVEETQNV